MFYRMGVGSVVVCPGYSGVRACETGFDDRRWAEMPGLSRASLVVGDRDGICYARHYGCHDYSGKRPVADGDLFDVASCTKVLSTTFAVMRLYDQGKLKVMEAVGRYLPELAATPVGGISLRGVADAHFGTARAGFLYAVGAQCRRRKHVQR